ncbi:MAG: ROK family transcriptional regulator [Candidatus Sphingomonas colombiensis]|nr:ROK family transcriptional regulator [Sphingomonas sp.]WEK42124.1 MAG: ROK family transcriptional regulator [Sphingomonas sp.]
MLTEMHAQILRLINQSGPLSRTELGRELGVSKGSMSALAADLIESGMLTEGEVVHGAGRPSIRLELAASSTFFIGVSLASGPFILRLTDMHGRVVGEVTMSSGTQPEDVASAVAQAVDQVLARENGARERLAGIGIAIPGLVDAASGACVRSTLLGWRDVPIGPMIAEATGFATFVENDANALALGEHLFGSLRGIDACAVVSVGDGIGCGLIINGELHRGARGGAGEIAHATIELNGLPCKCGKRGCLDTLASAKSIANFARNAGLPEDLVALGAAADHGDQGAVAILHKAGEALGLAVSQLIQALDPDRIVIALSDGPLDGSYAHVIRQTIKANVMGSEARQIDIAMMHLGPEAWAIGAASVAAGRGLFRI